MSRARYFMGARAAHRPTPSLRRWYWLGGLLYATGIHADELPPPLLTLSGTQLPDTHEATLYLQLLINGQAAVADTPIRQLGSQFLVRSDDLKNAGIQHEALAAFADTPWVNVSAHPDIQTQYDSNALHLNLIVPPSWLPQQRFSAARRRANSEARSGVGGLISYDLYASELPDGSRLASLWSEQRLFSAYGVLRNNGAYRHTSLSADATSALNDRRARQERYIRYDTQWSSADEHSLQNWVVGDTITGALSWTAPVRLGGVQIARDFRVRPDLITYPLPAFTGQAAVPTTLDLFINGQRTGSEQLQPGPFTLSDLPFVSGAGEATVVTTDALGRQIATTLPFYANAELLRTGLSDYSLSIGLLRQDFGLDNFAYGPPAAAGTFRYGISDAFTLEAQAEITDEQDSSLVLGGAGALLRVGMLGMLNLSASYSEPQAADLGGWQYTLGYQYSRRGFHIGYQGVRTQAGYRSLANHELLAGALGRRRSDVFTLGLSGPRLGSASLGLVDARVGGLSGDDTRVRLASLSYSRDLPANLSLYLNLSHDLHRRSNTAMLYVLATFGRNTSLSLGTRHDRHTSAHVNFTRSAPPEGGLGWQFSQTLDEQRNAQTTAALSWNNETLRMDAGMYGTDDQHTRWGSLRGSLVAMNQAVFASRQVGDAFVLISTDGVADVPVRYENQLVGHTDSRGHLLVPWVASHYDAKYSIDPLELPDNMRIPQTEQRIAIRRGSGARLDFPIRAVSAYTFILVDAAGHPLPVGAVARTPDDQHHAVIGHDGLVYFEDIPASGELLITGSMLQDCQVRYSVTDASPLAVGPLTCESI